MLAEELAIWAMVGVALLLVAAIIWRGEQMPRIETSVHENHPDYRHIKLEMRTSRRGRGLQLTGTGTTGAVNRPAPFRKPA